MELKVVKLEEAGYKSALIGLSLNKNKSPKDMVKVSEILCNKDGGHNKFLEHIYIWLRVRAPRYWWVEADTYRLTSKQSQSTIHTLMKNSFTYDDFEDKEIIPSYLGILNECIKNNNFLELKKLLPEGFMQTREWCLNYKTLRNIIIQRELHKLPHWQLFISETLNQIDHPELIKGK